MPRKFGHREGVRRYQRDGQTTLDVGPTLHPDFSLVGTMSGDEWDASFIGTCQSCGAYLDVRQHKTCPHMRTVNGERFRCDGYIG